MNKDSLFVYEEDGFCELKYSFKDLKRLERKNQKLHNNWNELKKWLEEQDIFITELPVFMKEIEIEHKTMSLCYKNILDKMTELERGEE